MLPGVLQLRTPVPQPRSFNDSPALEAETASKITIVGFVACSPEALLILVTNSILGLSAYGRR